MNRKLKDITPQEVTYNPSIPIDFFDFIIVDECHRSIYGKWRQVLEYFDAFIVGLTATPYRQTLGFFDQNLIYEYRHRSSRCGQCKCRLLCLSDQDQNYTKR